MSQGSGTLRRLLVWLWVSSPWLSPGESRHWCLAQVVVLCCMVQSLRDAGASGDTDHRGDCRAGKGACVASKGPLAKLQLPAGESNFSQ